MTEPRIPDGLTTEQLAKRATPAPKVANGKRCRYCLQQAQLLYIDDKGYPYRADFGPVWRCVPCDAHVGCHDGTTKPLGGLANADLREWRKRAHAAFDPVWRADVARGNTKGWSRRKAYLWLSGRLGLQPKETHIAFFDVEECRKTIDICNTEEQPS